MANRLLYLDYDGVLHPNAVYTSPSRGIHLEDRPGHALFEQAAWLAGALDAYPGVLVVLSTSWVPAIGFDRARDRLPPSLAGRVIGATWHARREDRSRWLLLARGEQVAEDAARRGVRRWLAVDDDDHGWPAAHRHCLIHCPDDRGLGDPATRDALLRGLDAL